MNVASEQSKSVWMDKPFPDVPNLGGDLDADIIVVGAGIGGLSAAYELSSQGKAVVVLDAGPPGGGMTSRTSGHLSYEFDDYYAELARLHGGDNAKAYFESQSAAVDRVEQIAWLEGIECSFARVSGYLFAKDASDDGEIEKEWHAARDAGFADSALLATVPGLKTGKAIHFPRQARFHVMKYVVGLVDALRGRGVRIFGGTRVLSVREDDDGIAAETENGHTIRALHAVIATNSPINDVLAMHTKQAPYRTYVFASSVPKGLVPDALIWDSDDPYHYVRIEPRLEDDLVIVGGEDHKSGLENDGTNRIAKLHAWAARLLGTTLAEPVFAWSGQVYEPVDHVSFAGRNPGSKNTFVITGDSGEGLTSGVAGAMLIADLIAGRQNRIVEELYDPARTSLHTLGTFVRENATAPAELAQHLTGGEIAGFDQLKPGDGALVRHGLAKVAAYRDEAGTLHLVSSTCTHLGCVVHFNAFERCWDCPCHGSQFGIDGEVLAGPARRPLKKIETGDGIARCYGSSAGICFLSPFPSNRPTSPWRRTRNRAQPPIA